MWLPETTRRELAIDRRHVADELARGAVEAHFTRELQTIDPDLVCMKHQGDISNHPAFRAGFWHVIRRGTPCAVLPLEGPNGEFREPGEWMFQFIQEQDLWNDRTQKMNKARAKKVEAARLRQKERERQARIDETNERIGSLDRESVLFSDIPWRARA